MGLIGQCYIFFQPPTYKYILWIEVIHGGLAGKPEKKYGEI
jgi:hypothetical protein